VIKEEALERERIKAMWKREAQEKTAGIKPKYGTLTHLKDVKETPFTLSDEQAKQLLEERHQQQIEDGKEAIRDQFMGQSMRKLRRVQEEKETRSAEETWTTTNHSRRRRIYIFR
jgi:hypothetical protein